MAFSGLFGSRLGFARTISVGEHRLDRARRNVEPSNSSCCGVEALKRPKNVPFASKKRSSEEVLMVKTGRKRRNRR